jgi:hypothetical protein
MYWNLDEAKRELARRQRECRDLASGIDEILGDNCPIPAGNFGFIPRQIATCRYEDLLFAQRCRAGGLRPIWLEYGEDAFCSSNPSKMRLVRMRLFGGVGKKGGAKMRVLRLLGNPAEWEGKPLGEIRLDSGENLREFHHRLRRNIGWNDSALDTSAWLKEKGESRAEKFYRIFFLVFVSRGILFESFESPGFPDLLRFRKKIVEPAWEWVSENFLPPLIVLHPGGPDSREKKLLNWYPARALR